MHRHPAASPRSCQSKPFNLIFVVVVVIVVGRRRRRRQGVPNTMLGRGGRRRGRAACHGVGSDDVAGARGAYAARGQSKPA